MCTSYYPRRHDTFAITTDKNSFTSGAPYLFSSSATFSHSDAPHHLLTRCQQLPSFCGPLKVPASMPTRATRIVRASSQNLSALPDFDRNAAIAPTSSTILVGLWYLQLFALFATFLFLHIARRRCDAPLSLSTPTTAFRLQHTFQVCRCQPSTNLPIPFPWHGRARAGAAEPSSHRRHLTCQSTYFVWPKSLNDRPPHAITTRR